MRIWICFSATLEIYSLANSKTISSIRQTIILKFENVWRNRRNSDRTQRQVDWDGEKKMSREKNGWKNGTLWKMDEKFKWARLEYHWKVINFAKNSSAKLQNFRSFPISIHAKKLVSYLFGTFIRIFLFLQIFSHIDQICCIQRIV